MGAFALKVAEFARKAKGGMHQIVRDGLVDVGSRLVYRTPVGNPLAWGRPAPPGYVPGQARGGWAHSTGQPASGVRGALDADGGGTVSAMRASIGERPGGKIHYFTNNVPYMPELERGYSKQAPLGIVAVTRIESVGIIYDAAARWRASNG